MVQITPRSRPPVFSYMSFTFIFIVKSYMRDQIWRGRHVYFVLKHDVVVKWSSSDFIYIYVFITPLSRDKNCHFNGIGYKTQAVILEPVTIQSLTAVIDSWYDRSQPFVVYYFERIETLFLYDFTTLTLHMEMVSFHTAYMVLIILHNQYLTNGGLRSISNTNAYDFYI